MQTRQMVCLLHAETGVCSVEAYILMGSLSVVMIFLFLLYSVFRETAGSFELAVLVRS